MEPEWTCVLRMSISIVLRAIEVVSSMTSRLFFISFYLLICLFHRRLIAGNDSFDLLDHDLAFVLESSKVGLQRQVIM